MISEDAALKNKHSLNIRFDDYCAAAAAYMRNLKSFSRYTCKVIVQAGARALHPPATTH